MRLNFDRYINDILTFKKLNCVDFINLTDLNCTIALCKLLESCTFNDLAERIPTGLDDSQYKFLLKIWFVFWYVVNIQLMNNAYI